MCIVFERNQKTATLQSLSKLLYLLPDHSIGICPTDMLINTIGLSPSYHCIPRGIRYVPSAIKIGILDVGPLSLLKLLNILLPDLLLVLGHGHL